MLEIKTINDLLGRLLVIAFSFVYIAGFIIAFAKSEKHEETEEKTSGIKLSDLTIKMLLVSLNIIYLLFSIIQFKYLFMNAGRTSDFDYATYARTGFFQLMFVSFINFALLHICKKSEENNKFLKIMLIIFTIIIVISCEADRERLRCGRGPAGLQEGRRSDGTERRLPDHSGRAQPLER